MIQYSRQIGPRFNNSMLIWFMNKIYLFFILVCCVQSYLLPFSYRLRLRTLTKAEDRNPPITAHTLTTVWPSCYSDYWQQNGVHVTVCLGLNFRTRPHSTLRKKRRKNKILRSTCGKCSFSKNSDRINIRLLNRDWIRILDCSFYEWIFEWTNKIIFPLMNSLVH